LKFSFPFVQIFCLLLRSFLPKHILFAQLEICVFLNIKEEFHGTIHAIVTQLMLLFSPNCEPVPLHGLKGVKLFQGQSSCGT